MSEWEQIAILPVDTCCVLISDPIFILPNSEVYQKGKIKIPYDYKTFKKELKKSNGIIRIKPRGYSISLGVAVQSGYGDGLYPVYVKYDQHGKIIKLMIDFIG